MNIYWSANSVPELRGYSKDIQRKLWRRALKENYKNKLVWLGYGLLFLTIFSVSMLIPSSSNIAVGMLIGGVIGGMAGLISSQFVIAAIRPTLAKYRSDFEKAASSKGADYFVPPAI